MDTKLKNFNLNAASGCGYGLLWVLMHIFTIGAGIVSSIALAFWTIYRFNLDAAYIEMNGFHNENGQWVEYISSWTGHITDSDFENIMSATTIGAIALAAISAVLLVAVIILIGRSNREADGSIHLNWFDKIWSEVHFTVVCCFACAFIGLVAIMYDLWPVQNWFGIFESYAPDASYMGIPNELGLILIIIGLACCTVLTYTSFFSMVKKLKARKFWEKSLVGGILLTLWRGVRGSDRLTVKIAVYLILLCAVAGFFGMQAGWNYYFEIGWVIFGAIICLLLIFAVVPSKIRKFNAIRLGAEAISGGDLTYKIPINLGRSGVPDELDLLAQNLNHIGEAQQIAVANELKNQRMKTELISNVSHDLKTPLTSMSAYVDLLKKEGLDSPNAAEYLDIVDQKTQRLKVLTENLFDAAKASSGSIPVNLEDIDLSALVTQSLAEMDEKLSEKNLQVIVGNECAADAKGCHVSADGQLLWRVIENLLGNVSKYALEGSRVYVQISKIVSNREECASKVILQVKNISKDQLNIPADELMERFKRGDDSRNTEGSGLGLAIAKDLTALMGGVFEISIDGDLFKASVVLNEYRDS